MVKRGMGGADWSGGWTCRSGCQCALGPLAGGSVLWPSAVGDGLVRCMSETNARKAFLGAAIFEKSGVAVNFALRGSTLMRFVNRFQSPRPKYSRSASLRPPPPLSCSANYCAWPGIPASAIHGARPE